MVFIFVARGVCLVAGCGFDLGVVVIYGCLMDIYV